MHCMSYMNLIGTHLFDTLVLPSPSEPLWGVARSALALGRLSSLGLEKHQLVTTNCAPRLLPVEELENSKKMFSLLNLPKNILQKISPGTFWDSSTQRFRGWLAGLPMASCVTSKTCLFVNAPTEKKQLSLLVSLWALGQRCIQTHRIKVFH